MVYTAPIMRIGGFSQLAPTKKTSKLKGVLGIIKKGLSRELGKTQVAPKIVSKLSKGKIPESVHIPVKVKIAGAAVGTAAALNPAAAAVAARSILPKTLGGAAKSVILGSSVAGILRASPTLRGQAASLLNPQKRFEFGKELGASAEGLLKGEKNSTKWGDVLKTAGVLTAAGGGVAAAGLVVKKVKDWYSSREKPIKAAGVEYSPISYLPQETGGLTGLERQDIPGQVQIPQEEAVTTQNGQIPINNIVSIQNVITR